MIGVPCSVEALGLTSRKYRMRVTVKFIVSAMMAELTLTQRSDRSPSVACNANAGVGSARNDVFTCSTRSRWAAFFPFG